MPMDEVIRGIERADAEDIPDLLHAVLGRYKELYPRWRFLFLSADPDNADKESKKNLEWIARIENEMMGE